MCRTFVHSKKLGGRMNSLLVQDGPLDRVFAVLDFVASQRKGVSVAEIGEALSLPLPSAHRMVGSLEERGLLQRAVGTKRFLVGNRLVTLSAKVIGSAFRTARRHAVLQSVSAQIGEQCEIGVVRDNVVVYVDSVRVKPPSGLQFDPGESVPIHCTSTGKIYLSRLPPRMREKLVRSLELRAFTENTITDPDTLLRLVEETKRRAWAKTNQEFVKGVVGCAVPIVTPDNSLIACLGVSVPVARVSFNELDLFIEPLQRAAVTLAETILGSDEDEDCDGPVRAEFPESVGTAPRPGAK
jgi:DNA-binding IclR family transcriptional regulator